MNAYVGLDAAQGESHADVCMENHEVAEIERTRLLIKDHHPMEIVAPLDLLGSLDYLCILIRFKIEEEGTATAAEIVRAEPYPLLKREALRSLYGAKFAVPEAEGDQWGLLLFELRADHLND